MVLPEIIALRAHRLDADLTYRTLAKDVGVSASLLHAAMTSPRARVNDRTMYKIRQYLASVKSDKRTMKAEQPRRG